MIMFEEDYTVEPQYKKGDKVMIKLKKGRVFLDHRYGYHSSLYSISKHYKKTGIVTKIVPCMWGISSEEPIYKIMYETKVIKEGVIQTRQTFVDIREQDLIFVDEASKLLYND